MGQVEAHLLHHDRHAIIRREDLNREVWGSENVLLATPYPIGADEDIVRDEWALAAGRTDDATDL